MVVAQEGGPFTLTRFADEIPDGLNFQLDSSDAHRIRNATSDLLELFGNCSNDQSCASQLVNIPILSKFLSKSQNTILISAKAGLNNIDLED